MSELTTLSALKSWLNLTTVMDDAMLSRLISAASSYIENILNRTILSQIYTDKMSGKGTHTLSFYHSPVTAVASLSIDGNIIPAASSSLQAGYLFSSSQLMLNGYLFTRGHQNITVTYTAGYTTVPYDIEQACLELCALRYKERDRIGQISKTIAGEVSSFMQKDMPGSVTTILQQYKRVITNL